MHHDVFNQCVQKLGGHFGNIGILLCFPRSFGTMYLPTIFPSPAVGSAGAHRNWNSSTTCWKRTERWFLHGIAGIGKSELAKAYAAQYQKSYTNFLYLTYSGDLKQDIIDMDFADDLPTDTEEERFKKHNKFLRTLKDDTLFVIDNSLKVSKTSCVGLLLCC